MRLGSRDNRPRNPLPLGLVLDVLCQDIGPARGKVRHHAVPVPPAQFIGEALRMGIPSELDLAVCLHDARHRPQRADQPVIFRHGLMGYSVVDQLGSSIVESL